MAGTEFRPLMARRVRSAARTSSKATGCLRATWWPRKAILSAVALATAASFDTWPAFFKMRRPWGAFRGPIQHGSGLDGRISGNRRSGHCGGRVGDRATDGQNRARHEAGLLGTSDGGFCKKNLAFDRCLSLGRR